MGLLLLMLLHQRIIQGEKKEKVPQALMACGEKGFSDLWLSSL